MAPKLYNPTDVGKSYTPRLAEFAAEGKKAGLRPSSADKVPTALITVDAQGDFCFPGWALPVPGAVDDMRRLVELVYNRPEEISLILASRDKHVPMMIFHAAWWIDRNGKHPDPFTIITYKDIIAGNWLALKDPKWSVEYVNKLEVMGKKNLVVWPNHCLENTEGQKLVPAVHEALAWHAAARGYSTILLDKGVVPQVEHYGIFGAEVPYPKNPASLLNVDVLTTIAGFKRILVGGEAKSHCVLETMKQLVGHFANQPDVVGSIHFLMDCTSSVQHPAVDFEALAMADLREMAKKGVVLMKSTDANL